MVICGRSGCNQKHPPVTISRESSSGSDDETTVHIATCRSGGCGFESRRPRSLHRPRLLCNQALVACVFRLVKSTFARPKSFHRISEVVPTPPDDYPAGSFVAPRVRRPGTSSRRRTPHRVPAPGGYSRPRRTRTTGTLPQAGSRSVGGTSGYSSPELRLDVVAEHHRFAAAHLHGDLPAGRLLCLAVVGALKAGFAEDEEVRRPFRLCRRSVIHPLGQLPPEVLVGEVVADLPQAPPFSACNRRSGPCAPRRRTGSQPHTGPACDFTPARLCLVNHYRVTACGDSVGSWPVGRWPGS